MNGKKLTWDWKLNPSSLLAILVATVALIGAFVRAEGKIDSNEHHLDEHTQALNNVAKAVSLSEKNNAVLMQWQREQDRRIAALEAK